MLYFITYVIFVILFYLMIYFMYYIIYIIILLVYKKKEYLNYIRIQTPTSALK